MPARPARGQYEPSPQARRPPAGRHEEEGMDYRKEFRVDPDAKVKLNKLDPAYKGKHASEAEAKQETESYCQKLARQQAVLYAEHKHSILARISHRAAGFVAARR